MIAAIGAFTALLTAIVTLYAVLNQLGIIKQREPREPPRIKPRRKEPETIFDHDYPAEDEE